MHAFLLGHSELLMHSPSCSIVPSGQKQPAKHLREKQSLGSLPNSVPQVSLHTGPHCLYSLPEVQTKGAREEVVTVVDMVGAIDVVAGARMKTRYSFMYYTYDRILQKLLPPALLSESSA